MKRETAILSKPSDKGHRTFELSRITAALGILLPVLTGQSWAL